MRPARPASTLLLALALGVCFLLFSAWWGEAQDHVDSNILTVYSQLLNEANMRAAGHERAEGELAREVERLKGELAKLQWSPLPKEQGK